MSGNDIDDELCIVYEKLAPPVLTQTNLITPPVISQKKAEAIKCAVRNKFFGVAKKNRLSTANANNSVRHEVVKQNLDAVSTDRRIAGTSFSTSQKEISATTTVWKARKVEVEQRRQSSSKLSCNAENANPNTLPSANPLVHTDCIGSTPELKLHNSLGGSRPTNIQNGIATQSSVAVESASSSHQPCLPSGSPAVSCHAPVKPVLDSELPRSSGARKCDGNSTVNPINNCVSSTSGSAALQVLSGKKCEMPSSDGRTVVNTKVGNDSVTILPLESQIKNEVLTDNLLSAVTSSFSPTRSKNELLRSKIEAINRFGTNVIPVSPPTAKLPKHPIHNGTGSSEQRKDRILKDPDVTQTSGPTNVTATLMPTTSVKQETVLQLATEDLNCVHSSQNCAATTSERQPTDINVTPSKGNNIDTLNKKLSPHLKAHPNKFLNPSPGLSRKATSSTPRRRSAYMRSPLNNSRRRNWRVAGNSPVKASVKKSLNFDVKHEDGSAIKDVPTTSGSTSMDAIYCKQFKIILLEVMMQSFDLFSPEEVQIIHDFINLSSLSKMLYIRMFSRKFCWHRSSEISYPAISNDLEPIVGELEIKDFVTLDYSGEDLLTLLGLLKVPELKQLCRNLNITVSATVKEDQIKQLLQYGKNQQTISPAHNYSTVIRKETKKLLGECFKLCETPRHLFQRILLFFSLSQKRTGPVEILPQLLIMHEVEIEKIKYPQYPILASVANVLFTCREEVVSFHDADDLCNELQDAVLRKNTQQILTVSSEAELRFALLIENVNERARASSLPYFLRCFCACSKYAYMLNIAVEVLRKEKAEATRKKAIEILEKLLEQDMFLTHYRGFWYDKLALIYHFHEKNLEKAADVVIRGMSDKHVTDVQKYNLVIRGHRIHSTKNRGISKKHKRDLYLSLDDCKDDPPSITINAKVLPVQGPGRKRVYVEFDEENQETRYSSVEEYAISYYKKQGYDCGYHTEGTIVTSLFALIFWDILYELPMQAVFLGRYQDAPLDLKYSEFYASRSEDIDNKLKQLEEMTVEQLQALVTERHNKHFGTVSLVNWNHLPDVRRATVLVACLGTQLLARICERLAKKYRMARSGFPDLLVWSPSQQKCKIVEVKGPSDHLSGNQVLWLNYLIEAGADAEVCHVQQIGSKSTKRKSTEIEDI